jgi:hypothetical protein
MTALCVIHNLPIYFIVDCVLLSLEFKLTKGHARCTVDLSVKIEIHFRQTASLSVGQSKAEGADLRLMVQSVPWGEPLQNAHSENLTL